MSCKDTKKLMLRYIDGELSAERASVLERHLAACSDCCEELKAVGSLYRLIDGERDEFTHNPRLLGQVLERIESRRAARPILLSPVRYAVMASLSAASVFTGIVLGSLFSSIGTGIAPLASDYPIELLADEYLPAPSNSLLDIQLDETNNTK